MTALTIKNIPESLYEELKRTAKLHRRSINNEVIVLLEEKLAPKRKTPEEWVETVKLIRNKIPAGAISEEEVDSAINGGRP
ncbi:hypothetical protein MNBD_GAMMA26-425 [hydrothermal vent metagenome]|uniref:Antitoxin FitA-like ribbon-helix-helix domain-containing protein n=1 Tax=hydrothermal vent metagenome TaxID=652676 RepID=A0A3B1ASE1_9ZZZZ